MQEQTKAKRTRKSKKNTSIEKLEALGDDLVSHLTRIGSSWQDFCTFLSSTQDDPHLDTKRLRDFIAAYHELFRALLDVQPPKEKKDADTPAVVILPPVQEEQNA